MLRLTRIDVVLTDMFPTFDLRWKWNLSWFVCGRPIQNRNKSVGFQWVWKNKICTSSQWRRSETLTTTDMKEIEVEGRYHNLLVFLWRLSRCQTGSPGLFDDLTSVFIFNRTKKDEDQGKGKCHTKSMMSNGTNERLEIYTQHYASVVRNVVYYEARAKVWLFINKPSLLRVFPIQIKKTSNLNLDWY